MNSGRLFNLVRISAIGERFFFRRLSNSLTNEQRQYTCRTVCHFKGNCSISPLHSVHSINSYGQMHQRTFSTAIEKLHEEPVNLPEKHIMDPAYGKEFEMVVLTVRADRVAGLVLGYTRRKMEYAILAGLVYLNGKMVTDKSARLKDGDMIDVIRKAQSTDDMFVFDRFLLLRFSGLTKNGKQRLQVKRFKALNCPPSEFWKNTS